MTPLTARDIPSAALDAARELVLETHVLALRFKGRALALLGMGEPDPFELPPPPETATPPMGVDAWRRTYGSRRTREPVPAADVKIGAKAAWRLFFQLQEAFRMETVSRVEELEELIARGDLAGLEAFVVDCRRWDHVEARGGFRTAPSYPAFAAAARDPQTDAQAAVELLAACGREFFGARQAA